jgi:hypothetical protein
MDWVAIAKVAGISAATGFGVYCFSCALHVWQNRNSKLHGAEPRRGWPLIVRRMAQVGLVIGLLGMVVSAVWPAIFPREGILTTEGLFTVRPLPNMKALEVTPHKQVQENALLVRHDSPEAETEVGVLRLRRESLNAERHILRDQPPALDPEVAQQITEVNAQHRTLQTILKDHTLERERLLRETLHRQLVKEEEIRYLRRQRSELQREMEQAQSASKLCREEYVRLEHLHRRGGAVSDQEYEAKAAELNSCEIEVAKHQEQLSRTDEQLAGLEGGLREMRTLVEQHRSERNRDIALLEGQLEEIAARQEDLQRQRADDLTRAERHRDECVRKIEIELEQVETELAGWKSKLEVRAPFAGRIVFSAPSPGSTQSQEPLVVLAPDDGLRFQVRLPEWTRASLQRAGAVPCQLLEDLQRDEQRRFVERRFLASLVRWQDLPAHAGYGLAELRCDLPEEAVYRLGLGEQIAARLIWQPPPYASPAFLLSLLVCCVGGAAWVADSFLCRRAPAQISASPASARQDGASLRELSTEFGTDGTMLRTLGSQLREMIARRELDEPLISAAEWALERHRGRAVRLLRLGLGDGDELCRLLDGFLRQRAEQHRPSGRRGANGCPRTWRRLLYVLRAAAPPDSRGRIARMARRLPAPPTRSTNGRRRYPEAAAPASGDWIQETVDR